MVSELNLSRSVRRNRPAVSENSTDGDVFDERNLTDFNAVKSGVVDDDFVETRIAGNHLER